MADDVLTTTKELNKKSRECVYILMANDAIVAHTQKYEMNNFLEKDAEFISIEDDDLSDVRIIYGLVLDPNELPFEIPTDVMQDDKHLWLLTTGGLGYPPYISIDEYYCIEDVAEAIEESLSDGFASDLDDFAVILGTESKLCLSIAKSGDTLLATKVYGY